MKILVITDKLFPDEHGGSCIAATELIMQWQVNNEVDIFTCQKSNLSNDQIFKGNVYRFFNKKNIIRSAKKLKSIVSINNYDIVVTHSVISWYVYYTSMKLFNANKIKMLAIFHGPWDKEAKYKYQGEKKKILSIIMPLLYRKLEYKYVNNNENFVFLSDYMKKELEAINGKLLSKNTSIIEGGINLEEYKRKYDKETAKKMLNIDENNKVIFTLRRIDKRMGIDDAILAFSKIPTQKRKKITFIVGGKGPYLNYLKQYAKSLGVDVRFEGFIPDDKINNFFCATDLFLVPTKDLEGFGLVNLESLAMGVPVLARPQGGMIELKDKFIYFYLAKNMSTDEMAKEMVELSDKYFNKVITEKNIDKYSWTNISRRYENLMEEIIKS